MMYFFFCGEVIAATIFSDHNAPQILYEGRRRFGLRTHFNLTLLFLLEDKLFMYCSKLTKEDNKSLIVVEESYITM